MDDNQSDRLLYHFKIMYTDIVDWRQHNIGVYDFNRKLVKWSRSTCVQYVLIKTNRAVCFNYFFPLQFKVFLFIVWDSSLV